MDEELCVECGGPTGKAGEYEDSLYLYWHGVEKHGPYCDTCFDEKLNSGPL